MIKIAPSIAAASLIGLKYTLRELEEGGADLLHIDIEDGRFVPMMNLGIKIIYDIRIYTHLPIDVHLMVENPEWLIPELARFGANRVSVHYEACLYPRRVLGLIKQHNMQAGLAFNPNTSIPPLQYCMPYLSFVLVLATEPEIKTCEFLPSTLEKITSGKRQPGLEGIEWDVDGGITAQNIQMVVKAGADVAVSGRGVFQNGGIRENIQQMKASSQNMGE